MIIKCKHWKSIGHYFKGKCSEGLFNGNPSFGQCIDLCEHCQTPRGDLDDYMANLPRMGKRSLPPRTTMAKSLAKAVGKAAIAKVTGQRVLCCNEQRERRFAVCKACEHYEVIKNHARCISFPGKAGCGCYLEQKIKLATETCKQGYWTHIDKEYT